METSFVKSVSEVSVDALNAIDSVETTEGAPRLAQFMGFMLNNPRATAHGYRDGDSYIVEGLDVHGPCSVEEQVEFARFAMNADKIIIGVFGCYCLWV